MCPKFALSFALSFPYLPCILVRSTFGWHMQPFAQLSSVMFGLFYCGYLPCFWVKLRRGLAAPALDTTNLSGVGETWPVLLGGQAHLIVGLVATLISISSVIAADTYALMGGKVFVFLPCAGLSSSVVVTHNPISVNILLAGYDEDTGPSLYYIYFIGTLVKLDKVAFGELHPRQFSHQQTVGNRRILCQNRESINDESEAPYSSRC